MLQVKFRQLKVQIRRLFLDSRARRHFYVGDAEHWEVVRNMQIQLLIGQGLKPDDRLLDIGSGTLRGGVPIIRYLHPGHYVGFEPRAHVHAEAIKEVQESGLSDKQPNLFQASSIFQAGIDGQFDCIWCFSVLFHMTDDHVKETLRFVKQALAENGKFLGTVDIGSGQIATWQEFPVIERPMMFYKEAAEAVGLRLQDLGKLVDLMGHPDHPNPQRLLQLTHA